MSLCAFEREKKASAYHKKSDADIILTKKDKNATVLKNSIRLGLILR
nr:MAG TPA: hypothetical protein [Caudoviricetes sp.]